MIKTIAILFIFSIFPCSHAGSVSDKELNTFLEAIKEKKDEELLISSPQFRDCQQQFEDFRTNTKGKDTTGKSHQKLLKECVQEKLLGKEGVEGGSEKLLEIANKIGLESFNKEASKTSETIRDYLSKRLHKAIYGVERDKKNLTALKEKNLVNHDIYYQLYAEQVGKNTLLETAKYCLENFGTKGKDKFLMISEKEGNFYYKELGFLKNQSSPEVKQNLEELRQSVDKANISELSFDKRYIIDEEKIKTGVKELKAFEENSVGFTPTRDLWLDQKNIVEEYEPCTAKNEKACKTQFDGAPFRSIFINEALKESEFMLAAGDPDKKLIKQKYGFCTQEIIRNMCEIYKCNNIYNNENETKTKTCSAKFGISITGKDRDKKYYNKGDEDPSKVSDIGLDSKNKKGATACNLLRRLQEYRVVLKGVKEIQKDNKKYIAKSGFSTSGSFKGVFTGKGGEIDKLTSISSQDLINNVDSLKNSEENAKKLREECLESGNELDGFEFKEGAIENEACAPLVAKMDKAKYETIKLDTEAKTAVRLREIESLSDQEQLKKYLEENNLDEYVGKLEKLNIEDVKGLISDDFKSKRMALIDSLAAKFKKEKNIEVSDDDEILKGNEKLKKEFANQTIGDIEQHKRRVETLFEYSNIVTSYLEIKDSETKEVVGSNVVGRNTELEKNEDLKNNYFSDETQSSGASGSIDYLQALGQIIDSSENEEEEKPIQKN